VQLIQLVSVNVTHVDGTNIWN